MYKKLLLNLVFFYVISHTSTPADLSRPARVAMPCICFRGPGNWSKLVIQVVTFLGCLSDPFKGLSDLQLGDEKVTLNHLEVGSELFLFVGLR